MTAKAAALALTLLSLAAPLSAKSAPLTVKSGETWLFSLYRGQPVRARKADPSAMPASGQILVTVRAMMGTTMTISSNNPIAYTYRAELIGTDKAVPTRSCTLPADGRVSFEHWPQQATAVRLKDFKPARKDGTCP